MSFPAEPLQFNDPLLSFLFFISGSTIVKHLEWCSLAPTTWKSYKVAKKLYKSFCILLKFASWPASNITLEKWTTYCIFGNYLLKQGQVKPNTVLFYLSSLRSHYVNHHIPLKVFDNPWLVWIIKGRRILFPSVKFARLPIPNKILEKITSFW